MKIYFTVFLLLFSFSMRAQVSGVVKDKNQTALPAVSVMVKDSYLGTSTNVEGQFSINGLSKGKHTLIIKKLGFRIESRTVLIDTESTFLDIVLEPEELAIEEVVVTSVENPAHRIIRQAQAHRRANADKNDKFHADFYSRGTMWIKNLPKKIALAEVDDEMIGQLDSTRSGIVYLSETVSTISFQKPNKLYENIVASKVSGDDRGFSFNTAIGTNFDFYSDRVELGASVVSPISSAAFNYYTYRLVDSRLEEGHHVYKIRVLPKRDKEPTVEGFLYIVEDSWEIYAVDFAIPGYRLQVPVIDTLKLVQQYHFNTPDRRWVKSLQTIDFGIGLLGININGRYIHNFSNYAFVEQFEKGTFGSTLSRMMGNANQKDSAYWANRRPVPLTEEEATDYVKKDSVQTIRNSKTYVDSVDRKHNRFQPTDVLTGYTYRNSHKKLEIGYKGLSNIFATGFNPVQGWIFSALLQAKLGDAQVGNRSTFSTTFQYGVAEDKLRVQANLLHRFNTKNYAMLSLEGGNKVVQFNENGGVHPFINMVSSLFFKENFMQLYQKKFITAAYAQNIAIPLRFFVNASYQNRQPLFNHTNYSFLKKDKEYVSNNPLSPEDQESAPFEAHKIFKTSLALQWTPGLKAVERGDYRMLLNEGSRPQITVGYHYNIGTEDRKYNHQMLFAQVSQSMTMGYAGQLRARVNTGKFFNAEGIAFTDYKHFNGNRTHIGTTGSYMNTFLNMLYYANSTKDAYFEAHAEHDFKGFVMNKLPLLNRLQWNLVVGYHHLSTTEHKPYHEVTAGFNNIGWGKFRLLRFDFVRSFQGDRTENGFVVGLKFLNVLN